MNSFQKEILKSINIIPKKQKSSNFSYNNYENEYKILEEYIDKDEKDHLKCLYNGPQEKDRNSNIKIYKHNLIEIDTETKYINASPINIYRDKYIIATQGPLEETLDDFWTMIEQYKCCVIVMLCNLKEENTDKWFNYWNENNKLKKYKIQLVNIKSNQLYIIREIKLINILTKNFRYVTQIHFIKWPDRGMPKLDNGQNVYEVLKEIIDKVDDIKKDNEECPIVVHCSAGIGRTGVFISMYFLNKEILEQINSKRNKDIKFSVFNLIRKLKEMRLYLVQNKLAYKFIYLFSKYLLERYNA